MHEGCVSVFICSGCSLASFKSLSQTKLHRFPHAGKNLLLYSAHTHTHYSKEMHWPFGKCPPHRYRETCLKPSLKMLLVKTIAYMISDLTLNVWVLNSLSVCVLFLSE